MAAWLLLPSCVPDEESASQRSLAGAMGSSSAALAGQGGAPSIEGAPTAGEEPSGSESMTSAGGAELRGEESDGGGTGGGGDGGGGDGGGGGRAHQVGGGESLDSMGEASLLRFDQAVFPATHNSYSGGEKRSILEQLDHGIRLLEFDIHDNDFTERGVFRLGHAEVGQGVERGGGNPDVLDLDPWLAQVRQWSDQHRGHSPITVLLDLKDDFTDNPSFAEGNFAALNAVVDTVLGETLFPPEEWSAPWPTVAALRDRILVVLSGDADSRTAYQRDQGAHPSISVNASGQVVEVHDSGRGYLWYWSGQLLEDQSIRWHRHGEYDTGQKPVVYLDDEGWIVEAHQSATQYSVWTTVGRLHDDFEIQWSPARRLDYGVDPSIGIDANGLLREIHRSERTEQHWTWTAERDGWDIEWAGHRETGLARFENARSENVRVFTRSDGPSPDDTLLYESGQRRATRIAFPQRMFLDFQAPDGDELRAAAHLFSTGDADLSAQEPLRALGPLRVWGFSESSFGPLPNFPATDTPFEPWYRTLMRGPNVPRP